MTQLQLKLKTTNKTSAAIAKELGISKTTVSNWIQGKSSPSYLMIPQLANCLECPIIELFEEQNNFTEILEDLIQHKIERKDYKSFAEKLIEMVVNK